MKILILSGAMIALSMIPAYAQSIAEKLGANAVLGITPTTQDFVTEAANSDMREK